ncbi:SGNH/GDSL hydrolase family protein [Modestobacter sp. SYSU DS0290]
MRVRPVAPAVCALLGLVLIGWGASAVRSAGPAVPVTAPTTAPTSAEQEEPAVRVVFLGDSYTAASETGVGYAIRTAALLGWTPVLEAIGGTGYLTAGTLPGGAPYAARVDEVVAAAPDVVVVQGSTNDRGNSTEALYTAARDLYSELGARLPEARIVVLGPVLPPGLDQASVLAVRDALRRAAAHEGLRFLDPVEEEWLSPPGGLFADGEHPNRIGYRELAVHLVRALQDPHS